MKDLTRPRPAASPHRRDHTGSSAAQLRAEFDRSFALPTQSPSHEERDFIILRVAGREFALAAAGLASIERTGVVVNNHTASAGPSPEEFFDSDFESQPSSDANSVRWVRLPSSQPALLGIRVFNGRIVAGFALSTLLGLGAAGEASYCVIVASGADLIAFAFDALLRLTRAGPEQMLPAGPAAEPWQAGTLLDGGRAFAVIGIASLLQTLAPAPSITGGAPTSALEDGKS